MITQGAIAMDSLEFVDLYLQASDEIKDQFEELLIMLEAQLSSPEEAP